MLTASAAGGPGVLFRLTKCSGRAVPFRCGYSACNILPGLPHCPERRVQTGQGCDSGEQAAHRHERHWVCRLDAVEADRGQEYGYRAE